MRSSHKESKTSKSFSRIHRDNATLRVIFALTKGTLVITAIIAGSGARSSQSKTIRRWGYQIIEDAEHVATDDLRHYFVHLKQRHHLADAIRRVRHRRYVCLKKRNDQYVLEVTELGKKQLVHYALHNLRIEPQKRWDGIWRIVLFDIPEKNRLGRDTLRAKLQNLGFLQFQKSAFVLPHPCRNEIDFIVQQYSLLPYVTFFEAAELGYQETKALAHFGIRNINPLGK